MSELRVGVGFDVHPFAAAAGAAAAPAETAGPGDAGPGAGGGAGGPIRPLVLGGVVIEGSPPLAGHSDADVVAHAVADALLGAAGLGDLGSHFPDSDPQWQGADSLALLAAVVEMVGASGWRGVNIDCSVVLAARRLAPHRQAMQQQLGAVVSAP